MRSDRPAGHAVHGTTVLRVLAAVVALVLVSGLGLEASNAASARRAVSVSRSVSSSTVLPGDVANVTGRISAPRGTRVALQRYVGRSWRSVGTTRLNANRAYRFRLPTRVAGTVRYRVYAAPGPGRRAGASRAFTLRVLPCVAGTAPTRGAAAWFGRPGLRSANPIVANLAKLICAAAPGAKIDIAMYFVTAPLDASQVGRIMVPLQRVAQYRKVRVRFLLEGKLYAPGKPLAPTLPVMRSFGSVVLCHAGCHNERAASAAGNGITHHKFITVSDMRWRNRVDPAVVVSSANWSQSQLGSFWQSAVLLYDDSALYRQFDIQWQTMATCAAHGCAAWGSRMSQLSLSPSVYALTDGRGLWYDTHAQERGANAGTGRGVTFSPWMVSDPLARSLRGYTCTPEHHTVRMAHMFVTSGRQGVIDALARLKTQGCDVQIILRHLPDNPVQDGVKGLRDAGLAVSCLPRMHNKVILVDAVRTSDGRVDKALWMGSQSLGLSALRNNDEALLRTSTADATISSARIANTRLYDDFTTDFGRMKRQEMNCEG